MNSSFFITGANGFIGQHLVNYLLYKGYEVNALVHSSSPFKYHKNLHIYYGDLRDKKSLSEAISPKSIIVNLAANPYHKILSYEVNISGTKNLLEVAKQKKITRFIHISSQATKIEKKGVYGKTKQKSDELISSSKLNYIILKPSLVYGPGKKGLFNKVKVLIEKLPFITVFGTGTSRVFPLYIEDLCKIIVQTAFKKMKAEVYDVGGEKSISYDELYIMIMKEIKSNKPLVHIPVKIGLTMAKIISFLPNPPIVEDNILGSTQDTHCDPLPILNELNLRTISLKIGMEKSFQTSSHNLKIAIVGLGKMGILHSSILSTLPNVEIVALVDTNPLLYSTISSMGSKGRFYKNIQDAFLNEKIDIVYICTPTFTHFELTHYAIKKGAHVFIEKPTTLSDEQNNSLLALKTNKIICTGYTLIYKRTFQKLKEIVIDKSLGEITSFNAHFSHGEVFSPKKGWMFNKTTAGGGVLMNPGPHLFSVIMHCIGNTDKISGDIKTIYSVTVEDEAQLKFIYPHFEGNVFLSWSVPNKPISETTLEVTFEKGNVKVTDQFIIIEKNNSKHLTLTERDLPAPSFPVFNINPEAHGEAYYLEDKLFIDAIKNNQQPITDIRFAANVEKMIHTSYQNATYGKKVQ